MDMLEVKKQHGGARPGAGRKTKYASTVVTRVPEKYFDVIKALIHHLDEYEMVDINYTDAVSEPVFLPFLPLTSTIKLHNHVPYCYFPVIPSCGKARAENHCPQLYHNQPD